VKHLQNAKRIPKLPPQILKQNLQLKSDLNAPPDGAVVFIEDLDTFDEYIYRLSGIIHSGKTAFQNVLIADTYNWGRMLVLDGAIQSMEEDEELYHEMLVQPAMLWHPDPKRVLIIGGGEGATLREVLVHRSVESATMVDIDREVVELCRQHLANWHRGAFEDPRTRIVYQDGRKFVENEKDVYDVVIIDVVDMLNNGPAQSLYTRQFYQKLRSRLRPKALVVVQGLEFSFLDDKPHAALARTLRTVFPEVHSYRVDIPSFLSTWGFLIASDWLIPTDWTPEKIDKTIQNRLGTRWLKHLTGHFLKGTFSLSKKTQEMLSEPGPVLEDGQDFVLAPEKDERKPRRMPFPIHPVRQS